MNKPFEVKGKHFQKRALSFKNKGRQEYLLGRKLILENELLPGAVHISISIENYMKAVLSCFGKSKRGHLDQAASLIRALKESGADVLDYVNEEFLMYLGEVYRTRYVDDLKEPINFGIHKWKLLAEADYTAFTFDWRVHSIRDGKIEPNLFEIAASGSNKMILIENHMVSGVSKRDFVERPGFAMAVLYDIDGKNLQITHLNSGIEIDSSWLQKGMTIVSNTEIDTSFFRVTG